MATVLQRIFIVLILFTAFGGRLVAYTIPVRLVAKEVIKKDQTEDCEKSSSSEKNQLEEKVKLADLQLNQLVIFDFNGFITKKKSAITPSFLLSYCHLQVPEQPPQ